MVTAHFPAMRLRRLRQSPVLRSMVCETEVNVKDFIYPLFVTYGQGIKQEIRAMPGQYRWSVDLLPAEAQEIARLGIPAVLLFGIPEHKDETGNEAWAEHGVVQEAVRAIKRAVPELVVITDVCMCEYTSHGHCGVIQGERILNDPTLELLVREAVSHVQAGADIVAPSDMMDGRVAAIRQALDKEGFTDTPILAYSAKYASSFYRPFREAAESTPRFGDRRAYQMDSPNAREALREIELDVLEGADAIMVKPAMAYLDIITLEVLTAVKRAGADLIITYHAKEAAPWLL